MGAGQFHNGLVWVNGFSFKIVYGFDLPKRKNMEGILRYGLSMMGEG
jgi:hypothetical protein